ncbi:hypothetical protein C7M84_001644 [Penaeus vannamei]|uniref:Uncharacterized protein n=1 Tax=Penaeus vannamei TaxID=6689 RepID=A0A423TT50_PENVA|nr:hypothetical protein C7M84_001644 [Penaeus vannamei]
MPLSTSSFLLLSLSSSLLLLSPFLSSLSSFLLISPSLSFFLLSLASLFILCLFLSLFFLLLFLSSFLLIPLSLSFSSMPNIPIEPVLTRLNDFRYANDPRPQELNAIVALNPCGHAAFGAELQDVLLAPDVERHEDVLGAELEVRHEPRHQDRARRACSAQGVGSSPHASGDMTDSESALADGLADPPGLDADRNRPLQLLSAMPLLGEFFITAALLLLTGVVWRPRLFRLPPKAPRPPGAIQGAELNPELLLDLEGVASAFSYGDADVFGKDLHWEDHALLEHVLQDELLQLLDGPAHIGGQARYDDGRFPVLGNVNPDAVLFPYVTDAGAALADGLAVVRWRDVRGSAFRVADLSFDVRELFEHQRTVLFLAD